MYYTSFKTDLCDMIIAGTDSANSKNPIPIIIPCHRVTKSNNNPSGYAFGTKLKQALLSLEVKNHPTFNL